MADDDLVTVHLGPIWEVDLLAGLLDEEGIPSFKPDSMTKQMDPFITGPNPLEARLQVREKDAERAKAIIEERRPELSEDDVPGAEPPSDDEDDDPAAELQYLSVRTLWSTALSLFCGLGLPFALTYGFLYVGAVREYGQRAPRHGLTMAALLFSVLLAVLGVVAVVLHATSDFFG